MKAAVFKEAGKLVVEDVPEPEAGPGEVVVKICKVGICGSDAPEFLEFIHEYEADMRKTITETISLDQVPQAFEHLAKPNDEAKIIAEF
jgi:threonine dehydrogenase-like Zn-dependent dehydrogenase